MIDWYEREEETLYKAFESGQITNEMLQEALRELRREYRGMAEEACRDAYEQERERW